MLTATSPNLPSRLNQGTMQAIVYDDYGDASVLHPVETSIPQRISGDLLTYAS